MTGLLPRGQRPYVAEGWMSVPELDFLYESAYALSVAVPGSSLEVGSWKGRSTSALALAGEVVAVDTFHGPPEHQGGSLFRAGELVDTYPEFEANLRAAGLWERVTVRRGDSAEVLPVLKAEGATFRLAFVDGAHDKASARRDMAAAWELLSPGGLLVVDDFRNIWFGGVHRAAEELFGERIASVPGTKMGAVWKLSS